MTQRKIEAFTRSISVEVEGLSQSLADENQSHHLSETNVNNSESANGNSHQNSNESLEYNSKETNDQTNDTPNNINSKETKADLKEHKDNQTENPSKNLSENSFYFWVSVSFVGGFAIAMTSLAYLKFLKK